MKKKIAITTIIIIVIALLITALVLLTKNNGKESINKIKSISINNLKIDDKSPKKTKNTIIDNANYPYEYNQVVFNTDNEDKIISLGFFTTTSGDKTYGIKESSIKYKNNVLNKVEDFNNILGEGKEELDPETSKQKYIRYTEDNYDLILTVTEEAILNVEIIKK